MLLLVCTYWAIVYSSFYVIMSTLIIYSFFYIFRGLSSNLIKDYIYDLQLKPRVNFYFQAFIPVDYIIKSSILLQAMLFAQNWNFAGLQATFGNCRRNRGLSYVRTHKIYKFTIWAPLRRIYAFGNFCRLLSIVLCRWSCIWVSDIQPLGVIRSALGNCEVTAIL